MSISSFIPNGRTSLVKKGKVAVQIQTEYAYRPYPCLTTTVSTEGRVLHKIEMKLERPIESYEEQALIENLMKKQHTEIIGIIREAREDNPVFSRLSPGPSKQNQSLADRIKSIPGVERLYRVDNDGNFTNRTGAEQFRKAYASVFKNIRELIQIFATVPGITMTREKGVYEVERDRLYAVSCGEEIYFVMVQRANSDIVYETALRQTVDEHSNSI